MTFAGSAAAITWLTKSYGVEDGGDMPAKYWLALVAACAAFGYLVGRPWAVLAAGVGVVGFLLLLDLLEIQGRPSATNPEPVGPLIFTIYLPVLLLSVWVGIVMRRSPPRIGELFGGRPGGGDPRTERD